ncbi:hypothetical protein Poli38472_008148 [Pythium oligandrum]|uniref:tRNA (guanosine(18)-2'-O)-methyltransferase TARBP1 n=1 Tax=Pythium oligandrum TaxID=41045 RepID=A0A8K1FK06_PYTOL|nr:hypothetical protein Poli38472_008148 [Pythium oligandrum]|eukprot:TMW65506.1 hypothetical protein Poli38472_008148 [Pythium oligandrum]
MTTEHAAKTHVRAAFTRHVQAAWTRWTTRATGASGNAVSAAEVEAQYQLLASGLVATLPATDVQSLWDGESLKEDELWSLLLPLDEQFQSDPARVHFVLVVLAEILAECAWTSQTNERAQWFVETLALPALRARAQHRVHAIVLSLIAKLVALDASQQELATLLSERVFATLVPTQAKTEDDKEEDEDEQSYVSLCRVFQIALEAAAEDATRRQTLTTQLQALCVHAITCFDRKPRFLRAVSVHLLPSLVASTPQAITELTQTAIQTWSASDSAAAARAAHSAARKATQRGAVMPGSQVSNLLYMLCLLLPKDPTLIGDAGLQRLIAMALSHEDPLLRKQALHLLKIAFSHYALTETSTSAELTTWQSFLTASDVIQLHHEQHLLEQVWPQVEQLIQSRLLVRVGTTKSENAAQWPVTFSFSWLQSLLLRVFRHENPIVRRMFLSNFMQACLDQLQQYHKASCELDTTTSFVLDPLFQDFVFRRVLRACNDPLMYKSSRRAPFQQCITQFLVEFLAFQLRRQDAVTVASSDLLNTYLRSACDAVFGPETDVHSPEAILSLLHVLENPMLQQLVQSMPSLEALNEASLDTVRFILEIYVLRSFPQSMRTQTLQSLQHALTEGFTRSQTHSLRSLASILSVFPSSHLTASEGHALRRLRQWLNADEATKKAFEAQLTEALSAFLTSSTASSAPVTASQLARMLIFTADEEPATGQLVLQQSVTRLVGELSVLNDVATERLLVVLGQLEVELAQLEANPFSGTGPLTKDVAPSATSSVLLFRPQAFYGDGMAIFQHALRRLTQWLTTRGQDVKSDDDMDEDELAYEQSVVASTALVATQLALYAMEDDGALVLAEQLNAVCEQVKTYIGQDASLLTTSVQQRLQDHTIAMHILCLVSSQFRLLDVLTAFEPASVLPLVLSVDASRQGTNSSRHVSDTLFRFSSSKWRLVHNVVQASSYVSTELLRSILTQCVDALFSAGSDANMLLDMIQVVSLTLGRLGVLLLNDEAEGEERLDEIFREVWTAYGYSKPKPDTLTRAMVYCIFQPVLLRRPALIEGKDALLKRWFRTVVRFGQVHRPNVVFHVVCRLVQLWRVLPSAALAFVDEIVELLIYKEPIIADKQKSPTVPDMLPSALELQQTATEAQGALAAKDRYVRFILLSFLDDVVVEDTVNASPERELMDAVLRKLLELQLVDDDWQRHHMLNSDGFGKKLRCWQAVTVLSKHIHAHNLEVLGGLIWKAFATTQLSTVRFYMEVVGMRLAMRFPQRTLQTHVLPLLKNVNLTPQVGVSLLLVSGFVLLQHLAQEAEDPELPQLTRTVLEAMLPWLNASHGHTRVMVQFLLSVLLPRYLQFLETHEPEKHSERVFFQSLMRFLSENKECKRMFRRQAKQFETFRPEFQCTMLGLLSSAHLNEFHELFPDEDAVSVSFQLKETMNVIYEQYQREHFGDDAATTEALKKKEAAQAIASAAAAAAASSSAINVQRKIDTSAILLDESVLPVAMKERDELVELNIRQKQRQPVIMCATLVDKVPNLAGLARTCEIFNASQLVLPNLRVCDDEAFQTISVTANKWIPMQEVKEDALVAALTQWKQDGYTIVAVEQTASSHCLSQYTFPEKMVVVLGKEKEGIPVDVLQMVDVCVEIPQFGLIRSLNVHVSGAILLWEYTQQRMNGELSCA